MDRALEGAILLTSGIHAGVAVSYALTMWPAVKVLEEKAALRFFADFYPRGMALQPALVGLSAVASIAALTTSPLTSLTQAAHIASIANAVAIVSWTKIVMVKDNNAMLEMGKKGETCPDAKQMLQSWGARHNVRTVICLGAFGFLTYAFLKR